MNHSTRRTLACLFFLSGFSSLVDQVVWTRLAFASFGIIAPVLSIVLSVFMLGLAIGSWMGGWMIVPLTRKTRLSAIYFYGIAELVIGLSAFAVPALFRTSEHILTNAGQLNSFNYLFYSALALGISIFPWCLCMGTTFPFMMAFVKEREPQSSDSFSFLYTANVLGAMCGTGLTAIALVETLGFRHTLWVAASGNFLITVICGVLGARQEKSSEAQMHQNALMEQSRKPGDQLIKIILFSTGFVSMAMEVIWTRGFAAVLKTQVYSFAMIIFAYLLATFVGSAAYRRAVRRRQILSNGTIFFWMSVSALIPIFMLDPMVTVQNFREGKIDPASCILLLGSICPLCGLLGYLTPRLVDQYSDGYPGRGGSAYAANVFGCILGPLVACYLLLPYISVRYSLILLTIPFILFWLFATRPSRYSRKLVGAAILAGVLVFCVFDVVDSDEWLARYGSNAIVRRDYIASVVAYGEDRSNKGLLVNGFGMTVLTPITKFISHLPLALHQGKTNSVLVICFGMGTSYRSALTWNVDTTTVELVPSVPKMFGFYHADAHKYANNPLGHIIIDDGRRYLNRCGKKFDVIVVDPPPPVEAAGSSLLFSTEFYTLAKEHLNPNGILQMWYPGTKKVTNQAVVRSMVESFPYVRCYPSIENWGVHMLGSMQPIEVPSMDQLASRFPAAAKADLTEWTQGPSVPDLLGRVLEHEYPLKGMLDPDLSIQITDDRPMNEYYLLRQWEKKD